MSDLIHVCKAKKGRKQLPLLGPYINCRGSCPYRREPMILHLTIPRFPLKTSGDKEATMKVFEREKRKLPFENRFKYSVKKKLRK